MKRNSMKALLTSSLFVLSMLFSSDVFSREYTFGIVPVSYTHLTLPTTPYV